MSGIQLALSPNLMVSPVPSSPAPRLMDPDMPMARTTSRAFILRVTSASALTLMVSKPNTRRKSC